MWQEAMQLLILQPSAHQLLHPSYSVSDNLILLGYRMLSTYTYVARPSILNILSTKIHKSGRWSQNYHESNQLSSGHPIRFVHGLPSVCGR
jgi:hypothetical protein